MERGKKHRDIEWSPCGNNTFSQPVKLNSLGAVYKYSSEGGIYDDHRRVKNGGEEYHFKPYDKGDRTYVDSCYEPFNGLIAGEFAKELRVDCVEDCRLAVSKNFLGTLTKVSFDTTLSDFAGRTLSYSDSVEKDLIKTSFLSCLLFDYDWGRGKTDCYTCSANQEGSQIIKIKRIDFSHILGGASGELLTQNIDYLTYRESLQGGAGLGLFSSNFDMVINEMKTYRGLSARKIYSIVRKVARYYGKYAIHYGVKVSLGGEVVLNLTSRLIKFRDYTIRFAEEILENNGSKK